MRLRQRFRLDGRIEGEFGAGGARTAGAMQPGTFRCAGKRDDGLDDDGAVRTTGALRRPALRPGPTVSAASSATNI